MGLSLSVIPFLFLKIRNRKINSLKALNKIQGPFTHKIEKGNKKKKKYLYVLMRGILIKIFLLIKLFIKKYIIKISHIYLNIIFQ